MLFLLALLQGNLVSAVETGAIIVLLDGLKQRIKSDSQYVKHLQGPVARNLRELFPRAADQYIKPLDDAKTEEEREAAIETIKAALERPGATVVENEDAPPAPPVDAPALLPETPASDPLSGSREVPRELEGLARSLEKQLQDIGPAILARLPTIAAVSARVKIVQESHKNVMEHRAYLDVKDASPGQAYPAAILDQSEEIERQVQALQTWLTQPVFNGDICLAVHDGQSVDIFQGKEDWMSVIVLNGHIESLREKVSRLAQDRKEFFASRNECWNWLQDTHIPGAATKLQPGCSVTAPSADELQRVGVALMGIAPDAEGAAVTSLLEEPRKLLSDMHNASRGSPSSEAVGLQELADLLGDCASFAKEESRKLLVDEVQPLVGDVAATLLNCNPDLAVRNTAARLEQLETLRDRLAKAGKAIIALEAKQTELAGRSVRQKANGCRDALSRLMASLDAELQTAARDFAELARCLKSPVVVDLAAIGEQVRQEFTRELGQQVATMQNVFAVAGEIAIEDLTGVEQDNFNFVNELKRRTVLLHKRLILSQGGVPVDTQIKAFADAFPVDELTNVVQQVKAVVSSRTQDHVRVNQTGGNNASGNQTLGNTPRTANQRRGNDDPGRSAGPPQPPVSNPAPVDQTRRNSVPVDQPPAIIPVPANQPSGNGVPANQPTGNGVPANQPPGNGVQDPSAGPPQPKLPSAGGDSKSRQWILYVVLGCILVGVAAVAVFLYIRRGKRTLVEPDLV